MAGPSIAISLARGWDSEGQSRHLPEKSEDVTGVAVCGVESGGGGGEELRLAESRRHSMASSPSGSLGTLEMSREKLVPQEPVGPNN